MSISVRNAETGDFAPITMLARDQLGYDCEDSLVKSRLEHLDNTREAVFVAENDGTVIGFIHVQVYEVLYYETMLNILGLAVSDKHRRMGVGSMLVKSAERLASEMGIGCIRLNSGGKRTGAHEFSRSQGFDNETIQLRFLKKIDFQKKHLTKRKSCAKLIP